MGSDISKYTKNPSKKINRHNSGTGYQSDNVNGTDAVLKKPFRKQSDVVKGTDALLKKPFRRQSSAAEGELGGHIIRNKMRTQSLRGTKSEPKLKLEDGKPNKIDRKDSSSDLLVNLNKPPTATRRRVSSVISTERGLMELYQLPLDRPFYVKLEPLFNVANNNQSRTKWVVTVWLKYALQKKISEVGQLYEADISFSEAKLRRKDVVTENNNNNNNKLKQELVMAHTWNGKTTSVLITRRSITFKGNFMNEDIRTLEYLEFELILNPIKGGIADGLLGAANNMTLMHLNGESDDGVVGPEKCTKMIGWFTFRDKRSKTYKDKEFVWRALINPGNKNINDTLHMNKI